MTAKNVRPLEDHTAEMEALLDYPYERLDHPLDCEWFLQYYAGNEPRVWAVEGDAAERGRSPLIVLWLQRQHVLWVWARAQEPTWYFSPVSADETLRELATWEGGPFRFFTELPGYIPLSTTCNQCLELLSEADRDVASKNASDYFLDVHYCARCDAQRMALNPDDDLIFRSLLRKCP